ncbi:MAG: methyltransferase domain-containing protein [Terriglobia bacterium]
MLSETLRMHPGTLAFLLICEIGVIVNACLFHFYRRSRSLPATSESKGRWEYSPLTQGGFSYRQLALVSAFGLFLELMMIRWISSEIRIFAYFKNFVLIACFLGFGLGCYMCRRRINVLMFILPLFTIVVLVKLPWKAFRDLVREFPSYLGIFSETSFWAVPSWTLNVTSVLGLLVAIAVAACVFALVSFVFIPVGQLVGWYLENATKGIAGYTTNILGSLSGILLYTFLCFLYQPPAIWFLVAGFMIVVFVWRIPRLRYFLALAFLACIALAALGDGNGTTTYWSPYQRLTIRPVRTGDEIVSYELNTNGTWYQHIVNLSPGFVSKHPELFRGIGANWNAYDLPYHFYSSPHSVLVLGAGTGNDVAAALRNGAGRVVAVEIDPLILKLGRELHFERPYDSPRVTTVLDDARSYLQNSAEKFDLIMFSLLDSHTTSSHFTNIRIDNYVYTLEALQSAKRHLQPDGLMIVKFWVTTPWIAGRLYGLLQTVFDQPPTQVPVQKVETEGLPYASGGTFYICGSQNRIAQALSDPGLSAYIAAHGHAPMEKATLTTDDWPYFYQHEPGITATVALISILLVLLCWFFLRQTGLTGRTVYWHFFFLGAGFLLLEAQIVSKMALLFGTTWAVNSIVIGGLLILIIAANFLVEYWSKVPVGIAYAGIFASILGAYFIPLEAFFFRSLALKMASATLVLCLPVFFAGIVFIRSFADAGFRGEAIGSNLLGALVGGLTESLSYWTGIRSLLILAAIFYLASWYALRTPHAAREVAAEKSRRLTDAKATQPDAGSV